jgi:multiple sugar transport system permease protein
VTAVGAGGGEIRRPRRSFPSAAKVRGWLPWYAFVLPPFALFLLFVIYPTLQAFRLSFFRQVGAAQQFSGLYQYQRLVNDHVFVNALLNTALLGVAFLLIVVPLATVLASLLNSLRRFSTPFKVIYFLPQVTSAVAVAVVFNYVFQPDWGMFNALLRSAGVQDLPLWLADPRYDLTGSRAGATILAVFVGLGYFMLITLAGLQTIPTELYDAAAIDGAGHFQAWRYVTLPSLRPTFVFLLITGIVDAMARFSDLWTLGGPSGTPARSLQSIVMYMYQVAFDGGDMNYASAIAVVFFAIVLAITLVSFRTLVLNEFRRRRMAALAAPALAVAVADEVTVQ